MIIGNGSIQILHKSVEGLDGNGFPIVSEDELGCPIPCQFRANYYSNMGKSDNAGAFVTASFEIMIDLPEEPFEYEQIRLNDKFGRKLGDYSIISATPLAVVGLLRIIV